jgi:hypothetical protein
MHDGHGSGSVWFVCLLKTKQNRKMLSDDSDEFFDKFEGYTIPKKKKKVVDEGKISTAKVDSSGNNDDQGKTSDSGGERSDSEKKTTKRPTPKLKSKVSRRSASEFLMPEVNQPPVGSKDPLGLERTPTYGEVRGTRQSALSVWLSLYDGELPDVVISKCTDASCDLCSVTFDSPINARIHYAGKPHNKKCKKVMEEWVAQDPPNRTMPTMKQPEETATSASDTQSFYENRDDHDDTFCNTCTVELSSKIVATSHYQGKTHAKQLRKRIAGTWVQKEGISSFAQKRPKLKTSDVDSGKILADRQSRQGSGNRFFCMCCKLHFTASETYNTHLSSREHKAKASGVESGEVVETVTLSTVPTRDSIDEMLSNLRSNPKLVLECSLCKVQCSSQDTLTTHLVGKQHKRKLEMANRGIGQFICKLCSVETTDQVGLDMHIAGKKHQKKAATKST